MGPGGELGHDPAVGRVQGILRTDHVRKQRRAGSDDRRRRLVAGRLDRQDAAAVVDYCGVLRSSPSISSVSTISWNRFLKLVAWMESDHMTIASSLLSV